MSVKKNAVAYGTGHRKSCTARVFVKPGTGNIVIEDRNLEDYFANKIARMVVQRPLEVIGEHDKFDVYVTVKGGGIMGQAGAICHGLARALASLLQSFSEQLRNMGLLTVDARKVERKKVGKRKARKEEQFSKR